MITYISYKFNKIIEEFTQILTENEINIFDSEQKISEHIIQLLLNHLTNKLEPSSSFVSAPCPKCGKKHLAPMESFYQRNIIFKVSNLLIHLKIQIFRMKCSNCGSTHAVLPDFCIPFKRYSKQAIIEIAIEASEISTENISEKLNIDPKQIRRLVNIVKDANNNILQLSKIYPTKLKNNITIDSNLHTIIQELPKDFEELYFKEFRVIFLYKKIKRKIYINFKKLSI